MGDCLGLEILGSCSDYANNQLSVLNIGVFLGVIGVFFAGYQLLRGIHKIRFEIKWRALMYIFLIPPVVTIIIATILPFIPGESYPIIGYPIFWEIFTALYVIPLSGFIGFLFLKKISKFDNKNGVLNKVYLRYIARNKEITHLSDELGYFFQDFKNKFIKEHNDKIWGLASEFLGILQNQRIINEIIMNPYVMQTIIDIYKKDERKNFTYDEKEFLRKVILGSFSENNSFLSHELGGDMNIDPWHQNGIILGKIIEDLPFLEKLDILSESAIFHFDKDLIFARNYLNFTARIQEQFRKKRIETNYKLYGLLFDTFKSQAHIISRHFKNLEYIELHNLVGSNFEYDLSELEASLLKIYDGKFPDIYLNPEAPYGGEYHHNDSNKSLLDAYAFGIFELFEAFAWNKEDTRTYTIEFDFFRNKELILQEIEKRLLILFKQIIPDNLDGHYAPLSRIFWDNYFWDILNANEKINKNEQIIEIVLYYASRLPRLSKGYIYAYTDETLKDPYKKEKALEKSRKIIANLFPKNIDYDEVNNLLNIYDYDRLSFQSIDLSKSLTGNKIVIKE